MRNYRNNKISRAIFVACVQGNIKSQELYEYFEECKRDPERIFDILRLLDNANQLFEVQNFSRSTIGKKSLDAASEIYEVVNRKRMSKSAWRDLVAMAFPHLKEVIAPFDVPLREQVESFVAIASVEDREALRQILASERSSDPYLAGILRKKKGPVA
ncbi:hypothetical protein [Burkholderia sp. Tr-20390]|uniref:hypothetical protein n=1 Tax=Burkholderia sp. Tr-20390 TaxID=2703904 RepID=UPI00197FB28F|nr:hypothetical protein [Burkholderia sp. Tr-20390]MBN3735403.1 hypothetical protein [Burkholderia sp. Tr-20390]